MKLGPTPIRGVIAFFEAFEIAGPKVVGYCRKKEIFGVKKEETKVRADMATKFAKALGNTLASRISFWSIVRSNAPQKIYGYF